mmetsp:Transcript_33760/g.83017  ORF Transcript_33760/g.83017 Transcript_33760/m.83017 type:complete len:293 (-) Transcript_33760:116-994(-)
MGCGVFFACSACVYYTDIFDSSESRSDGITLAAQGHITILFHRRGAHVFSHGVSSRPCRLPLSPWGYSRGVLDGSVHDGAHLDSLHHVRQVLQGAHADTRQRHAVRCKDHEGQHRILRLQCQVCHEHEPWKIPPRLLHLLHGLAHVHGSDLRAAQKVLPGRLYRVRLSLPDRLSLSESHVHQKHVLDGHCHSRDCGLWRFDPAHDIRKDLYCLRHVHGDHLHIFAAGRCRRKDLSYEERVAHRAPGRAQVLEDIARVVGERLDSALVALQVQEPSALQAELRYLCSIRIPDG